MRSRVSGFCVVVAVLCVFGSLAWADVPMIPKPHEGGDMTTAASSSHGNLPHWNTINHSAADSNTTSWFANTNVVGNWLRIDLKRPYLLSHIDYYGRTADRFNDFEIYVSDHAGPDSGVIATPPAEWGQPVASGEVLSGTQTVNFAEPKAGRYLIIYGASSSRPYVNRVDIYGTPVASFIMEFSLPRFTADGSAPVVLRVIPKAGVDLEDLQYQIGLEDEAVPTGTWLDYSSDAIIPAFTLPTVGEQTVYAWLKDGDDVVRADRTVTYVDSLNEVEYDVIANLVGPVGRFIDLEARHYQYYGRINRHRNVVWDNVTTVTLNQSPNLTFDFQPATSGVSAGDNWGRGAFVVNDYPIYTQTHKPIIRMAGSRYITFDMDAIRPDVGISNDNLQLKGIVGASRTSTQGNHANNITECVIAVYDSNSASWRHWRSEELNTANAASLDEMSIVITPTDRFVVIGFPHTGTTSNADQRWVGIGPLSLSALGTRITDFTVAEGSSVATTEVVPVTLSALPRLDRTVLEYAIVVNPADPTAEPTNWTAYPAGGVVTTETLQPGFNNVYGWVKDSDGTTVSAQQAIGYSDATPAIENIVTSYTADSITVAFDTTPAAFAYVEIGVKGSGTVADTSELTYGSNHAFTFSGLQAATEYTLTIYANDVTATVETWTAGLTFTWTGNGDSNNDGSFNVGANWDRLAVPAAGDIVVLPAVTGDGNSETTTRTITVDADAEVATLTMNTAAGFWNALVLNADLKVANSIGPNAAVLGSIVIPAGRTFTVHNTPPDHNQGPWITGAGDIVSTGNIRPRFTRADQNGNPVPQFTGRITVESGDLHIAAWHRNTGFANNVERITLHEGTRIWGTSHLRYNVEFGKELHMHGGTIDMWPINGEFNANITLTNNTAIVLNEDSELYINWRGKSTYNQFIRIESTISGAAGLTKTGPDEVELSGTSTYYGPTIVQEGTLKVTGFLMNSHVTVKDGAVLWGAAGSFPQGVTVEEGGTWIQPYIMWSGNGDPNNGGNWSDPDNWFGVQVPNTGDTVYLTAVDGQGNDETDTREIIVDVPVSVAEIQMGPTLAPYHNLLTVAAAFSVGNFTAASNATVYLNEGTTGTFHDIPSNGPRIEGLGDVISTGTCQLEGWSNPLGTWTVQSGVLQILGQASLGPIAFENTAEIIVLPGATLQQLTSTNRRIVNFGHALHLDNATLITGPINGEWVRYAGTPTPITISGDCILQVNWGGYVWSEHVTISGPLSGTGRLIKTGVDEVRITGESPDYTGELHITEGSVRLNGDLGGSVRVASAPIPTSLSGTGGAAGQITIESLASFLPGPGVCTFEAGSVTFEELTSYSVEISDATGGAGTGWDLLAIDGSLNLPAGQVEIIVSTIGEGGLAENFDNSFPYLWPIMEAASINGFGNTTFTFNVAGFANERDGGQFGILRLGETIMLSFTPGWGMNISDFIAKDGATGSTEYTATGALTIDMTIEPSLDLENPGTVTGYMITESLTTPDLDDARWIAVTADPAQSVAIQTPYQIRSGSGTIIIAAWAKDSRGSIGLAAQSIESGAYLRPDRQLIGDTNEDCVVNILDLIFVRNLLGTTVTTEIEAWADMNEDGVIDLLDLMIVRENMNAVCDED